MREKEIKREEESVKYRRIRQEEREMDERGGAGREIWRNKVGRKRAMGKGGEWKGSGQKERDRGSGRERDKEGMTLREKETG